MKGQLSTGGRGLPLPGIYRILESIGLREKLHVHDVRKREKLHVAGARNYTQSNHGISMVYPQRQLTSGSSTR